MGLGSSAIALLALVISGYLFNLIAYPIRYFSVRAEGQKLFFMAAGSGLLIGAAVFAATGQIKLVPGFQGTSVHLVAAAIDAAIPVPYACRLVATILAAIGCGFLVNGILWLKYGRDNRPIARRVYNRLTDKFGNPLAQMLRRAADGQKLVMLTLKSRKIYCGRILEVPPNIDGDQAYVEFLPSFSGYRDKETLRLGPGRTEYPIIKIWEVQQYLYSLKGVLDFFEEEIEAFGDIGSAQAVAEERERLESEIRDTESALESLSSNPIDVSDWIKVIPVREIESATFYDPDSYDSWFASIEDAGAAITQAANQPGSGKD